MLRNFTPRLYQQTILGTAARHNTLVVLPTGLGKTAIAFLLAAQRLNNYPNSKILLLAPTKPLCEQHVNSFREHLDIPAEKVVLFTGSVSPEKRAQSWEDATVVVSTPQCVTGDTIIYTKKNGPISIKEFVESYPLNEKKYGEKIGLYADINEEVLGLSKNKIAFVKGSKCWKLPCNKLIYLKTEMNNELKCTPEHPLLTIDELGNVSWQRAEDLRKNSYIAMSSGSCFSQENVDLYSFFKDSNLRLADSKVIAKIFKDLRKMGINDNRYYNYKRSMPLKQFFSDAEKADFKLPTKLQLTNSTGRSEFIKMPRKLSPELAYLLGALLADGHIGNRSKKHGNEVVYSELFYPTILQRFSDKLYSIFGINESSNDPSKGLIYYSTALAEILYKLGVPKGNKSKIIRVPRFIFNSSQEEILSFLSGVLNADGDFHKHMIRACSISKEFINDLRWLLLKINIPSSIEIRQSKKARILQREINCSESYHLIISGVENINKIINYRDIDPVKSKNTREELRKIKKKGTRSKEILPVKKALKKAYEEHRKNGGSSINEFRNAYFNGYLSKAYLRENLPKLQSTKARELLEIMNLPLRWVKIKEKKEILTNEYVYDLTIEKEHNFVANLLINHNTVENDIINSRINLKEVSLLIFDEAHHATGEYAYVWIADQYDKTSSSARILALTASPGSDMETVKEVTANLKIEKVEVRTEKDADVKPYVQTTHKNWVEVEFPQELKKIQLLLKDCRKSKLIEAQHLGYCSDLELSKGGLLALQLELQKKITSGFRDFELLRSLSVIAEAMKVDHALELLETQGIRQLHSYFKKMQQDALTSKVKAVQNLMQDELFKSSLHFTEELLNQNLEHPKLPKLREIIQETMKGDINAKTIIFTQFRDSAEEIVKTVNELNIKNHLFVGQAKKNGSGFSQKQQKEILDKFSVGEFNVLVATSVAEEGLDIPKVDKVIFYEPIPSAIRSIQRRGRTGRLEEGEVTILLTKGTRDEAYRWSAHHKEKRMYRNLDQLKKEFSLHKNEHNQANEKNPGIGVVGNNASLTTFMPPEKVVAILADHREKNNRVVKELIDAGIPVKTAQLTSADYIVSGKVGIELKKVPDFVASIIDGRILDQVRDLKNSFPKAVLVIEGEEDIYAVRNVHANAIRGMLASIVLDFHVPVLYTKNPQDTAALLVVMAKREQGKEIDFSPHSLKPKSVCEQQEFIVSSFPNIGMQTARILLEHFGSIKNLVNASEAQLTELKGIGDKTAKQLVKMFEEEYLKKE